MPLKEIQALGLERRIMYLTYTILLACLSGYLYRMGGSANKPKWMWKARDVGCNLCVIGWLLLSGYADWLMIVAFGLMWGAFSSYWGWLSPNDDEEYWWNFGMHGFFIGLALFPLAISGTLEWMPLLYRSLAMGVFFIAWTQAIKNAVVSEAGRGVATILTLLIIGVA